MTEAEQAACQADLDAVLAAEAPGARGKVRYADSWIDEDGETYDGYWYAEVRLPHDQRIRVLTFDCDVYTRDRETWLEVLHLELDNNR